MLKVGFIFKYQGYLTNQIAMLLIAALQLRLLAKLSNLLDLVSLFSTLN